MKNITAPRICSESRFSLKILDDRNELRLSSVAFARFFWYDYVKVKDIEIMVDYQTGRIVKLGDITPEWWI